MKGVFEDAGEEDFMDVEMSLNVKCTSEDTMDVTSNDLTLDVKHPEVHPVGEGPPCICQPALTTWTDECPGPFLALKLSKGAFLVGSERSCRVQCACQVTAA